MELHLTGKDILKSLKSLVAPIVSQLIKTSVSKIDQGRLGKHEISREFKIPSPTVVKYLKTKFIQTSIEKTLYLNQRLNFVEQTYNEYLEIGKKIVSQDPEKYNFKSLNQNIHYINNLYFKAFLSVCENPVEKIVLRQKIDYFQREIHQIRTYFIQSNENGENVLSTDGLQQITGTRENLEMHLSKIKITSSLESQEQVRNAIVICDYILEHLSTGFEDELKTKKIKLEALNALGFTSQVVLLSKSILNDILSQNKSNTFIKNIFAQSLEILIANFIKEFKFSLAIKVLDDLTKKISGKNHEFKNKAIEFCNILKTEVYLHEYYIHLTNKRSGRSSRSLSQANTVLESLIQTWPETPKLAPLTESTIPGTIYIGELKEYLVSAKYQDVDRISQDSTKSAQKEILQNILADSNIYKSMLLHAKICALTGTFPIDNTLSNLIEKMGGRTQRDKYIKNIFKILEAYTHLTQNNTLRARGCFESLLNLEKPQYSEEHIKFLAHIGLARCAIDSLEQILLPNQLVQREYVETSLTLAGERLYISLSYLEHFFASSQEFDADSSNLQLVVTSILRSFKKEAVSLDIELINKFKQISLRHLVIDLN